MKTIPKELLFNEAKGWENWALSDVPQIGTVGCFCADRAPSWDLFIVVDFDKETHTITAIFPRMRYDEETDQIKIGQDKLKETFQTTITCKCSAPCQGDDFCCHCGADELIREEYQKTFEEVADIDYETRSFVHDKFRKFDYVYHQHVNKETINFLDTFISDTGQGNIVV